ncbi:MAG: MBL fold metallo-hydrolase [Pseudomonadota bacterium]|nr:MBL fold metallo-hydrolase [Pseudomonadota bacterium]MEC8262447.1 MBL fold metallo-hydrolase [Pseudomonadota bacterium]
MIFRQMFDSVSSTYTYLLASRAGGEALLIDPVFEKTDRYIRLLEELDLKLVKVVDTHVHADHITAMGALRDRTNCVTVMGEQSPVDVVSMRVSDGERVTIEGIDLTAMHTPGHTDDSYCFRMDDRVFTGDTLLIRGTGRTDFQNGDAGQQYDSLFDGVLKLPESTLVYPAHDYKGDMVSTIGEERANNPRLQVGSRAEYIELMAGLNLPNPKMMDVAVPENIRMGLNLDRQREVATVTPEIIIKENAEGMLLVDLREEGERVKSGIIPGSVHAPYSRLDQHLGMLRQSAGRQIVFYCAVGERSTMAVSIACGDGIAGCAHIPGGFIAWAEAGGNVARV